MRSIKVFLTLTLLSVATLLNFAAALRGYQRGMQEAEALFNEHMREHAELLAFSLPDLRARGAIGSDGVPRGVPARGGDAELAFQWLDASGRLLARSARMPTTPLAPLAEGFTKANFAGYRWHALVTGGRDAGWIVLAQRDDERFLMAESIILPAVLPMLVAVPLLGAIIWMLLHVGLKPVARLAREVGRREASDLAPVTTAELPRELQPLATSVNALLHRLEASFARERRFSADAAHELRTPIAGLMIQCDNLAFSAPAHAPALAKLQAGIGRLSHLVEQILVLNRVAPDQYMARFEPIALGAATRRVLADLGGSAAQGALDVEWVGDDVTLRGDRFALDSLLRNLIGNAIKYTPPGGRIRVQTAADDTGVTLDVIDSGAGIPADERARVFDRFYRVHGDRHDGAATGCGLGLSIVQQVVALHGARIELRDSIFDSGLWVRVVFPRGAA